MASRTIQPLTGAAKAALSTLESHWSGSIHLSMLSSPLRKCIVTQKTLPTSLLIGLKAVTLPPPTLTSPAASSKPNLHSERIVLLPDALSAKHAPRKPGKSIYFTCDRRIYAELERRGSYKMANPRATLGKGMEGLIWELLGERCVVELEALGQRFGGRKRGTDLFSTDKLDVGSYTIRVSEGEQGAIRVSDGEEEGGDKEMEVFEPRFSDPLQKQRLRAALEALVKPTQGSVEQTEKRKDTVYYVKQSHITAPLGVALYRLRLWEAGDGRVKKSTPTSEQGETTAADTRS